MLNITGYKTYGITRVNAGTADTIENLITAGVGTQTLSPDLAAITIAPDNGTSPTINVSLEGDTPDATYPDIGSGWGGLPLTETQAKVAKLYGGYCNLVQLVPRE
jgi:hypothetical protein